MLGLSEKRWDGDDGVQILLNRMESHPEEFISNKLLISSNSLKSDTRWDWVFQRIVTRKTKHLQGDKTSALILPFLSDEEVDALYARYIELNRDCFKQEVMRVLLAQDDDATHGESTTYRIGATGLAVVTRDR
jgi:hypothetical protein